MQAIETAWKKWFEKFAPYVFTEGELVEDPSNTLYPRITFSYQMGDFAVNTITSFQVWTWSHNNSQLWEVCNKISEYVPVLAGTKIYIPGETYFEYKLKDGTTGRVDTAEEINKIMETESGVKWWTVTDRTAGELTLWRGDPFLTPSPKDEALSRVMYGTLQTRYRTTK